MDLKGQSTRQVQEGSQEEVSIQEPFDKRETQGPVPIRAGAFIRKMGLRSQRSKVMGQRSLYTWRKGIIQSGAGFAEGVAGLLHYPLSGVQGRRSRVRQESD